MAKAFLPIAVNNAGVSLEEIVPSVLAGPPVLVDYVEICRLYRQIAIGELLMSGDPRPFFENLFKSSRAFLFFCQRAPKGSVVTSKAEAFFDAVVCRDHDGARQIAAAAPRHPDTGREYEEDFSFVRFAMDSFGKAPKSVLEPLLDSWEAIAAEPDLRAEVCRKLLGGDSRGFNKAVKEWAADLKADFKERIADESMDADEAAVFPHVSIEVLAMVELADRAGLQVLREYPMAPAAARKLKKVTPPDPEAWKTVEGYSDFDEEDGP